MDAPLDTYRSVAVQHYLTEARRLLPTDPNHTAYLDAARQLATHLDAVNAADAAEAARWRLPAVPLPWLTAAGGLLAGGLFGWGLHVQSLAPGGLALFAHAVLGF